MTNLFTSFGNYIFKLNGNVDWEFSKEKFHSYRSKETYLVSSKVGDSNSTDYRDLKYSLNIGHYASRSIGSDIIKVIPFGSFFHRQNMPKLLKRKTQYRFDRHVKEMLYIVSAQTDNEMFKTMKSIKKSHDKSIYRQMYYRTKGHCKWKGCNHKCSNFSWTLWPYIKYPLTRKITHPSRWSHPAKPIKILRFHAKIAWFYSKKRKYKNFLFMGSRNIRKSSTTDIDLFIVTKRQHYYSIFYDYKRLMHYFNKMSKMR